MQRPNQGVKEDQSRGVSLVSSTIIQNMFQILQIQFEPLQKLVKKQQHFIFVPEQRKAFKTMKKPLSKSETIKYFDIHTKTLVIADTSSDELDSVRIQIQKELKVIAYANQS